MLAALGANINDPRGFHERFKIETDKTNLLIARESAWNS